MFSQDQQKLILYMKDNRKIIGKGSQDIYTSSNRFYQNINILSRLGLVKIKKYGNLTNKYTLTFDGNIFSSYLEDMRRLKENK